MANASYVAYKHSLAVGPREGGVIPGHGSKEERRLGITVPLEKVTLANSYPPGVNESPTGKSSENGRPIAVDGSRFPKLYVAPIATAAVNVELTVMTFPAMAVI